MIANIEIPPNPPLYQFAMKLGSREKAYDALFVDKKDETDKRARGPRELRLQQAHPFDGDLRKLPQRKP